MGAQIDHSSVDTLAMLLGLNLVRRRCHIIQNRANLDSNG